MKVSEIMTRRIISVSPEATILDAARLMIKNRISGLPVVDKAGRLTGMISEGDLLRRPETGTQRRQTSWYDAFFGPERASEEYVRTHGSKVHEVMTRATITVEEDAELDRAVHLMEKHHVKRLPVLRANTIVGIVSRANLVRALIGIHRSAPAASHNDMSIREQIFAEMGRESWSSGASVDVIVRNGVVDLWGEVADPSQVEAIRVLAEAVPGVTQVFDHLTCNEQVTVT